MRKIFTKIVRLIFQITNRNFRKDVFLDKFSNIKGSLFDGNNAIGTYSSVINCVIGKGAYLGNRVSFVESKIGNFSSIGDNVKVIAAQHPVREFISTSPLFYTTRNKCKAYVSEEKYPNFKYVEGSKYRVIIGNDVWIGSNVIILGGVTIGDGSVIATGSIVTKNVEPFSIVGGVPAKHISFRFEKTAINILLNYRWWNKSDEWLSENAQLFSNVNLFIENARKETDI